MEPERAKAGAVRIDAEVLKVLRSAEGAEPARFNETFEEGQLSGPHGPKFVGFAEPTRWDRWRETVGLAGAIATLSFGVMLAMGWW